jgi:heme-degrading monooxygenase HmoA
LTVLTITWRTLNSTLEWTGSMSHVVAWARAGDRTKKLAANSLSDLMRISFVRVERNLSDRVDPTGLMLGGARRCMG